MLFTIIEKQSSEWSEIINLIKQKYNSKFHAEIFPDPQYLILATKSEDSSKSEILACAGVTFANTKKLFSEQYLDRNIEFLLSDRLGRLVERNEIAEIGGLISTTNKAGSALIKKIPFLSQCLGAKYLLCTVTEQVRYLMQKNQINFEEICDSRPYMLDASQQSSWGNYYANNPKTGFIKINTRLQANLALNLLYSLKVNNKHNDQANYLN